VIIFGSVRFFSLKNNQTGKKRGTQTKPEPVQTDRFRFGFGSVFEVQNQKNLRFFFSMTEMCLSSALNLLPQNLINIIKGKERKGNEVMLIVIFSEKTQSLTSNVGYMDREGINLGSATKEQNARETATTTNNLRISSSKI
jgi:hypothetical protein